MSYIQFFYGKPDMVTRKESTDYSLENDQSQLNSTFTHERLITSYHHYSSGSDNIILVYKGQTLDDIFVESKRFS